jgi:DNA-directed RNA polymerase alpha subunit
LKRCTNEHGNYHRKGRGYVPAEENKKTNAEFGVIAD